jgi:3-hydroxyisobutyrate dehydrogenase
LQRFCSAAHCEAGSLAEMGRSCRLVITMLPDGKAVRQVLLGEGGIAAALAPGSVVLDMTSAEPVGTRELGPDSSSSLRFPWSMRRSRAASSGRWRAHWPSWRAASRRRSTDAGRCWRRSGRYSCAGGSGSGHAVKALNNYLSAVALAATAEAMMAGESFGIDPKVMLEILNHSTGRNTATEQKYPAFVLPRTVQFRICLGIDGEGSAHRAGSCRSGGHAGLAAARMRQLWNGAERRLGFSADNTDIVRYLEAGTSPHPMRKPM